MNEQEWTAKIGLPSFYQWQYDLWADKYCRSRLIRIPTGFGKTLGVLSAWLWNRVERGDDAWPRRLIWCLPMRVLVEQTESEVRQVLERLGILWKDQESHKGKVGVHLLMGGSDSGEWQLYPEECAVLIGTQDMLLSRALNRGYGAARARWPMDFGLLNQDALWVMDEVQLMDVGLATSAQLQAFRYSDTQKPEGYGNLRPCQTWWMSATLQESWLQTVDTEAMLKALPPTLEIPAKQRQDGLWEITKTLRIEAVGEDKEQKTCADLIWKQHLASKGLTLVVLNTVDSAVKLFGQLQKLNKKTSVDLRLVHSRFRPAERSTWRQAFLQRDAVIPSEGRIIVATQVIEAGVDISACTLITDLAPWPSLVQRFGRCARYAGESGNAVVLDRGWSEKDEKKALPYEIEQLLTSRQALEKLKDVSPKSLEEYEASLTPEERSQLYPYKPKHLLLQREWIELFDTSPDLSGADLDISRFIRSGEENDCLVFWRDIPETGPDNEWRPLREELCTVPFLKARDWLGIAKSKIKSITRKGKITPVAWVWDWLDSTWKKHTEQRDLLPGTIVLVDAAFGGYSPEMGWDSQQKADPSISLDLHLSKEPNLQDMANSGEEHEDLSAQSWRSLIHHLRDVGLETQNIVDILFPANLPDNPWLSLRPKVVMAAFAHDIGKASEYFQGSIDKEFKPASIPSELQGSLLAKAPKGAWPRQRLYCNKVGEHRKGFRHELASTLALFDLLRQFQPTHPGLLGECRDFFSEQEFPPEPDLTGQPIIQKSNLLSKLFDSFEYPVRWDFDLVAYLVASHHGKVRCSLQASPLDQEYRDQDGRGMPIRGICEGDTLPSIADVSGSTFIPATTLTLEPAKIGLSMVTGPSWTERVQGLLDRFGPGALAYLEALLRAADIRASQKGQGLQVGAP
ncbi:MAG TPA: DEAD/DEAH box helicase [Fibrobacteraceae bacterium]|nr:DEAD/DEAH box helicase [Fibrobacteraceae bacterium]